MKFLVKVVLLLLCVMWGSQSFAQVYLGGLYGVTEPSNQGDDEEIPEIDNDVGFRVYLGNELSEKFAFEIAYIDLGEYDVGTVDGLPDPQEIKDTLSLSGYDLSFVGKLPFRHNFSVLARLGVFVWEGERLVIEDVLIDGNTVRQESLFTSDEIEFSAGLGFEYGVMEHIGVTLEANLYQTNDVQNILYGAGAYFTF